jgi:hypothetical protein
MNDLTRSRPAFPVGIIGMVALVFLIETMLVRCDRFMNPYSESWRLAERSARREALTSKVLCFGDSRVEFSVLPAVLGPRLGRSVYNLSVQGGTPESTFYLLRRTLEAGARPEAVIVDFPPHQFIGNHEEVRARTWPELASVRDAIDLAWMRRDPDAATSILLAEALPSFKSRLEIRAEIQARLSGSKPTLGDMLNVPMVRRNITVNRGGLAMFPSTRKGPDPSNTLLNSDLAPREYRPDLVALTDRFLRMAASHSIKVYWLVPPISPEYQVRCEALGTDALYTALLRSKLAEHKNLTVIDVRHAGYGPTLFVDSIHLDCRGATALSDDLGDAIASDSGKSRWIELPLYRERPPAVGVEDLLQSRLAFERAWATSHR